MSEKREKKKGLGEILTFIVGIVIVYFLAKSGAKPAWQKSLDKSKKCELKEYSPTTT